jgi:hypothetical protein
MRQGQVVLATDFLRSQDPVFSIGDPTSTFSRAYSAYRQYPYGDQSYIDEVGGDVLRCDWKQGKNGLWIRGARLELGSTNRARYSCEIDNATWVKDGAIVTDTKVTLPDASESDYDILHEDSNLHLHRVYQSFYIYTANDAVFSARVYPMNRDKIKLYYGSSNAVFDLGDLSVVGGANILHADIEHRNPWYLVWMSFAQGGGYQWGTINMLDDSYNDTYTGLNQDSMAIWGVQLEDNKRFPSSLIISGSSYTSRTADSDWQVEAPLPDRLEGWLGGKFLIPHHTPAAEIPILTLSDGGAAADRIRLVATTGGVLELQSAATGGDSGLVTGSTAAVDGNVHSWYITWRPNGLSLFVDGHHEGSDHVVTIPDGLDRLELHPCGGVIGDIQMGDKYNRIPWRIPVAL